MVFSSAKSALVLRGNSPSHNWISLVHLSVFPENQLFCIPDFKRILSRPEFRLLVSDLRASLPFAMENNVDLIQIIVK